jgi:hypothetical protein
MTTVESESLSSTNNAMRLGNALHAKKITNIRKSIEGHQPVLNPATSPIVKQDDFVQKLRAYSRKWNEGLDCWNDVTSSNSSKTTSLFINACSFAKEASSLTEDANNGLICELMVPYHVLGFLASSSLATNQKWKLCIKLEDCEKYNEKLEQVLKAYNYVSHGEYFKNNIGIDPLKSGTVAFALGFQHGRLDLLDLWHTKTMSYLLLKDFPSKVEQDQACFDNDCNEILFLVMIAFPMLFSLHRGTLAEEFSDALGFEYGEKVLVGCSLKTPPSNPIN